MNTKSQKHSDIMQLTDTIHSRYSCRAYSDRAVEPEKITEVLEAARLAPSACNRQPWRFIVVKDNAADRAAILQSYNRPWIEQAPVLIVACGVPSEAWVRPFDKKNHTMVDVSIAVEHICLAATNAGLGTCWVCNFDPEALRSGLSLDESLEPVAIIPLGYPAEGTAAPEKKRKTLEEITICRG